MVHLYDMLYWCKTIVGLYLGYLETTQNSLNESNLEMSLLGTWHLLSEGDIVELRKIQNIFADPSLRKALNANSMGFTQG